MTKDVTWALAISTTKARILRGLNKDATTDDGEWVITAEHKELRDIMSDKPGRSFSSVGHSRSAMEYASDPVQEAERAFVLKALAILEKHRQAGDFNRLVIAAGPEMLGMIRDALPHLLADTVIAELPKNLLHDSEQALAKRIADHIFHP